MNILTTLIVHPKNLAILVLISTIAFAVSPFVTPGFGGFTADQFPVPQVNPPVQPSGYAFSIWGVIYLWLIAGAVYGTLRAADDQDWRAMRWPLTVSLVIGCFWIAAANTAPILATVMIILMAANLSTSNWPVITLASLGVAALTLRTILSVMKEETL